MKCSFCEVKTCSEGKVILSSFLPFPFPLYPVFCWGHVWRTYLNIYKAKVWRQFDGENWSIEEEKTMEKMRRERQRKKSKERIEENSQRFWSGHYHIIKLWFWFTKVGQLSVCLFVFLIPKIALNLYIIYKDTYCYGAIGLHCIPHRAWPQFESQTQRPFASCLTRTLSVKLLSNNEGICATINLKRKKKNKAAVCDFSGSCHWEAVLGLAA